MSTTEPLLKVCRGKFATYHGIIQLLCYWMPRLIILHMAMIVVVGSVTDPPTMIRYKNGGVCDVAHNIIDLLVAAEALMATADSSVYPSKLHTCARATQTDVQICANNKLHRTGD